MKSVHIKVDDNRLEAFLTIVKSIKKDIVKDIIVKDVKTHSIPKVSDAENQYFENILKDMSIDDKLIDSEKSFRI